MVLFNDGVSETEIPDSAVVETDVLIVGSGPAGSSAALFLSSLGVPNIVITKYRWTANTPRAHITNQRTMEIFRDLGIEDQVLADATPHHMIGDTVFCTSIAGEEIGRILTWGNHPARHADYELASPSLNCDIPQTYLEPILVRNATMRGTQTQFSTEYVSHQQDEDGVTVRVLNRLTGHGYTIRAKYLIGADGARSRVAADVGLPYEGRMDIAGSMNITFKADIAEFVGHRPSVLYWVVQPGSNIGGIGAGLVRMVRPWNEWLIVWGFDIAHGTPEVSEDDARQVVRNLIGVPDLDVDITGISLWGNNEQYATRLHAGRVFCAGDAVHKHPPSNGLGSNTSIQDSYNLAWKLAAVLKGQAGVELLETYTIERAPVAKQIVTRANKSGREFGKLFEALGIDNAETAEEMNALIESRKNNTAEGAAKRQAIHAAMEIKNYEFNAHGVELGQHYDSSAIVPDGTEKPAPARDPELYYEPSTYPGGRLPHAWIGDNVHKHSTHDLAPYGQFTVFTGITGEDWTTAAQKVSERLGVTIGSVVIGPGQDVTDLYFDWAKLREVAESGAVLVRPDKHVGWRADRLADDPEGALYAAVAAILNREN
ncbi:MULTISPECIES: FAD-dependent oxidoreductase [Micrococcaceae]|uniref:2,4-dichlorophenol 6-monooxygenase n=4 Tax=Micrococcaceae TaxID=1268 RepID=A0ACC6TK75_9MICC|nr:MULTISPECIES: FAD-dependent monooxygenase [Micrococcaceae]AAO47000.1 putative monooxygenase [Pseudarthrobacter chlorophenolicus]ACL42515.1 monooxygenase FAD-binding [Pseudarthrobacter chlorophenolicus A6]ELT44211.1 monooxygenase FAD-binding protein [Arthrobacter nitrophenolicus]SDQ10373.1 2,4-dichlorophenol 6-monooxygenase [Pseudarthrobacter chlorophenolicus]